MNTASLFNVHVLFSFSLPSLIALGKEVLYVCVELVVCVYVNVLKKEKQTFLTAN